MTTRGFGWAILLLVLGSVLPAGAALQVFVSIPPQSDMVSHVGGTFVECQVLLPPGQNHHTFEPSPRQLSALSQARCFFAVGLPYEKPLRERMGSLSPKLEFVGLPEQIQLRPTEGIEEHEHAGEGHETKDPHSWLCPKNAALMVNHIAESLARLDPEHAAAYRANAGSFHKELEQLDLELQAQLKPFAGRTVYVYHPAFGYFTDAYGLKQRAVELEGKEPAARQLVDLIERAKADGVRAILVQKLGPAKPAETLASALGGRTLVVDALDSNLTAMFRDLANKITEALKP